MMTLVAWTSKPRLATLSVHPLISVRSAGKHPYIGVAIPIGNIRTGLADTLTTSYKTIQYMKHLFEWRHNS